VFYYPTFRELLNSDNAKLQLKCGDGFLGRSVYNMFACAGRRTKVHVQLDNSKCTSQCFDNTDRAAEYIAQSLRQGWKSELPIYAVQCQSSL